MDQNIKNLLRNNLKHVAGDVIYNRGMGYYRSGHIQSLRIFLFGSPENKVEIRGEVMGTDDYKSSLVFDWKKKKFEDLECTCPCDFDCKHSVALGLKFIDLLQEFFKQADESGQKINSGSLRKDLTEWANNQDLGREYAFDEYDEERDYLMEDSEESDGGELEHMNELCANSTKEELIDELTDALSIGDAPQNVIDRLIREIAEKNASEKISRNKTSAAVLPPDKNAEWHSAIFPETALEKKKFNANNYYLIIRHGYGNNISDIEVIKNGYIAIRPDTILKEHKNLSKNQKELFEFLKSANFYYGGVNYEKLFGLLKNSEIKIYLGKKENWRELIFEKERLSGKIKAELNLENRKDDYSEKSKDEFVFKLDNDYKKSNPFLLFFDQEFVIKIENYNVSFHKFSKSLVGLLRRVSLEKSGYYAGYAREEYFEAVLLEDEIIKLNQIIKDCGRYLDFQTKLKQDFQITKFTSAEPCIVVDYNNKKDSLKVKAAIDYGFKKINVGESVRRFHSKGKDKFERWGNGKYIIKTSKEKIEYAPIKSRKEIKLYQQFCYFGKECGFKRNVKCEFNGEREIFKYFAKHWDNVKNLGYKIEFIRDEFQFANENFKASFNVGLDAANDWLGFDVNCYCGDAQVNLDDLRRYIKDKKEFIKLDSGRILKITNKEELERFIFMLESFYAKEDNKFEGKLYHAAELENIFTSSKYYNAKVEKGFEKFIKEVKSGKPVKKIKISERFNKILRDYQKDGIDWLYFLRKYRFAGILADDMGLGKTLQALVLIEKEKIKNKPSVVICPKTLLYNWQNEAKKFVPKLKTIIIDGSAEERKELIKKAKNCDFVITGYAAMQKDYEFYGKQKIKFNYCILDEAQFIKNYATKNAQIVKKINADYRLALTGTPLENSVSEIWSIFDFLMPGFLGSYNSFAKKFQNPIMKHGDSMALNNLRKKIECFMLRRVKSEVLKELPPKIEQISRCHLEKAQNILYQEILANVKNEIFETVKEKGFNKSRIHILAGLTKLRQVCNHPVLLLKDDDYTKYESAKLNMFLELISGVANSKSKVLVFSQFTKMLDILAKELDKDNIGYSYLSGKTKKRQELIDDFNENDGKQVFLISLKAGGTGLNLTSANNVIIFDPWWNPSVENQAIDRTHRIGQKNSVNVYRLITEGTIEERIVKLQEKKKFLFDSLVGESKNLFTELTWDDIKELFQ